MKKIPFCCMILSVMILLSFGIIDSLSADQTRSCPKGMTLCNGTHCAYLKSDESACGSCGKVCPPGLSCFNGTCGCLQGETLCSGTCVDTSFDINNCGKCCNSCPGEEFCINGGCGCAPGNLLCNETCIDENIDDNNCGKCGNVCPSDTGCRSGACIPYVETNNNNGYA